MIASRGINQPDRPQRNSQHGVQADRHTQQQQAKGKRPTLPRLRVQPQSQEQRAEYDNQRETACLRCNSSQTEVPYPAAQRRLTLFRRLFIVQNRPRTRLRILSQITADYHDLTTYLRGAHESGKGKEVARERREKEKGEKKMYPFSLATCPFSLTTCHLSLTTMPALHAPPSRTPPAGSHRG